MRSLAAMFLLLSLLGGVASSVHQVGHAATLSPQQRRLQQILAKRRYWTARLKAEQRQEHAVQSHLTSTQGRLTQQQAKLQAERDRAAAQQARLQAALTADENRVATVRSHLSATRAEHHRVHAEAMVLIARLHVLKAKIKRELGSVRTAVVQLYDLSQVSPLEQVLEARSLTDLLKEQSFVAEIGQRDTAILLRARAQHLKVLRIARVYLNRMRELKALQAQEKTQLALVVVETQKEDVMLLRAQQLTQKRQQTIQQEEASISALATQEQEQLHAAAVDAQSDQQQAQQAQSDAEKVAVIIGEQTGVYPNVGGTGLFVWPVVGPISQPFGPSPYAFEPSLTYNGVFYQHFHTGLDIAAPFETPVRAAGAGRVLFASLFVPGHPHLSYGLCVIIQHNQELSTLYAHLDDSMGLAVQVGQIVSAGQIIGYEGVTGNTTGPHLHFEVRVNGVYQNPLNFLPKQPE